MKRPILSVSLLILMTVLLTGCGASLRARQAGLNTNTTDLSSLAPSLTECNKFESTSGEKLRGKIRTYYDLQNRIVEDMAKVLIEGMTNRFDNDSKVYFSIFRWRANSVGHVDIDSNPLDFRIEIPQGNTATLASGYMKQMYMADVARIKQQYALTGSTAEELLSKMDIVLLNVDYTWSAVKIVLYQDKTVISQADVLLAPFSANPATYAKDHPLVLNELHPSYSFMNQGWSDQDFISRSQAWCF